MQQSKSKDLLNGNPHLHSHVTYVNCQCYPDQGIYHSLYRLTDWQVLSLNMPCCSHQFTVSLPLGCTTAKYFLVKCQHISVGFLYMEPRGCVSFILFIYLPNYYWVFSLLRQGLTVQPWLAWNSSPLIRLTLN